MANIKKNFNFRNGVQVDDDNLLVTDTGLVGIGTTIPNEALDVRGNIVVTGFTSSSTAQIGVLTVTTFVPNQIVGAGLSVLSGIVTAQGAGILTYFGDARNLQGMPTSQWEDKDVGLGFTSIYNTGGNVGVGTEDPRSTFQVGNNADAGEKGVGISSVGNINMTGIVTASSFIGAVTGDVAGRITGDVVGNINSAGVSTFITLDVNGDVDFDGHTHIDNMSVSGVSTFASNIVAQGNLDLTGELDVDGGATIDNIQIGITNDNEIDTSTGNLTIDSAGGTVTIDDQFAVSGVTTFSGVIEAPAGMNKIPSLYMNQSNLPSASDYHGMFAHVHSTGRGYYAHANNWYELVNKDLFGVVGTGTERYNVGVATISNLIVTGISTFNNNINVGFVGASSTSFGAKMGVGTTEAPVNEIQVRKSGNAEIRVTSETGIAAVSVGRDTGNTNTNNGAIRYGGGLGYPYSSDTSLDVLNYGTGNFNYYISASNSSGIKGDFHWHRGANSARLMTLTGIGGSLGIGVTQPSTNLQVEGGGSFSGNVSVGNNLTVGGALLGNVQGTLTGNVAGTLDGNSNTTVGISTLNNLTVSGVATVGGRIFTDIVGIGTDEELDTPFYVNSGAEQFFVTGSGSIGIKTSTELENVTINASSSSIVVDGIGVGSTVIVGAADFKNAGPDATRRFMIPPKVTTTQRGNLSGVIAGAMVYNTSVNRLQVFNGSTWKDCFT
jgi:hypothetical protein